MRLSRRNALRGGVWSCLGMLTSGACASSQVAPSFRTPLLGQAAPDLGRSLDGEELSLHALRGKVVVIDFFADYCVPCQQSLPALRELQAEHPEVAFVGVSLDEHRSDALALVARHRLTFKVVHDRSRVVAGRFRVRELPVTFIVDRRGVVSWAAGPEHTPPDLERALESLL